VTRPPAPTAVPSPAAAPAETPRPAAPTPAISSPLLGTWAFRGHVPEREIGGTLRFFNEAGRLAGVYAAPNGRSTPLSNITLDGEKVSFGIVGSLGTWNLIGVLNGDRMNGTFETLTRVVPWEATREGTGRTLAPPAAGSSGAAAPAPAPRATPAANRN
jgi:hypothetical protein